MGFAVFSNNRRFAETAFDNVEKFESVVKQSHKLLFGPRSIYLDLKNKVESQQLGGVIPDGFLFDLNDREDPQFYLVEAELERHDFMKHIFPQITKFFAFYRNSTSRSKLIEKLFEFVSGNPSTKKEFEQFLTTTELYKSIKDVVENSQNILLIADGPINEVAEIQGTYTDTWGKYVKSAVLKEYSDADKRILIVTPSFDELKEVEAVSPLGEIGQEAETYNEAYHLEDVNPTIAQVYNRIKEHMTGLDQGIVFNPQHYYISIRKNRNFAFLRPRKNKLKVVVMLPFEMGSAIVKANRTRRLSLPVQTFYNGSCFEVQIENTDHLDEVFKLLETAYKEESNIVAPRALAHVE